ncbi:hypothetical protein H8356DRAFT_1424973 [Neocallimastix lanati (nom. inval.)]|nr:hypothetical protein H8356DRAFT_1424973 [Neocallimastix sp. JGI-2020a]
MNEQSMKFNLNFVNNSHRFLGQPHDYLLNLSFFSIDRVDASSPCVIVSSSMMFQEITEKKPGMPLKREICVDAETSDIFKGETAGHIVLSSHYFQFTNKKNMIITDL